MRGVDLQVDRLSVDAFVRAGNSAGFVLNFSLYLSKVVPPTARYMVELRPLFLTSNARRGVRYVDFIMVWLVIAPTGDIDELQDQRSSSDNATSSRKKVSSHNVFQH